MLCFLSRTAEPDLDVDAVRYPDLLTDLISDHLSGPVATARRENQQAAAADCGLGIELELLAVERALEHRDMLPADTWLGLNLSAEANSTPSCSPYAPPGSRSWSMTPRQGSPASATSCT